MADDDKTPNKYNEQVLFTISKQPGIILRTYKFSTDIKTLQELADKLKVGFPNSEYGTFGKNTEYIASVLLDRLPSGLAELTIQTSEKIETSVWNLDFHEIQKPIRSWKANDTKDKPDLTKLAEWEALKEKDLDTYNSYRTDASSSSALSGNTLELAKMIRESGIEYYSIYTPVITRQTSSNVAPSDIGSAIGKIAEPSDSDSTTCGDTSVPALYVRLAQQWLKTGDRIQGNIDGTKTRIETWIGADAWNKNLYDTVKQ